uniref:hypothetical protein n=1 Tax=Streptomyces polyasparticus TaxID=2767826 RepID=UPI00280BE675|nr:hypothetical protein [Streptomyces polyasparticus]
MYFPHPDKAVLLDRTGRLTEAARALVAPSVSEPAITAQQRIDELTNWTLALAHVLDRGELARAHALLTNMVAPQQLQLLRVLQESTTHWLSPSRALEQDLPAEHVARYAATTASMAEHALRAAARSSWAWSRELSAQAAGRWGCRVPASLHEKIADRLNAQS